jgi:phosphatidylserine/phosphatidylglycerophosphate/cardiolipin synthase-like enzyme
MFVDNIVLNSDIFLAMIRLIDTARDTIILSSYVCDGRGSPGREIAHAINVAGQRGVKVRIMYSMSAVVMRRRQKALSHSFLTLLDDVPTLQVRAFVHYLLDSMHMKLLVVDSQYCLVSGANIQSLVTDCGWFDTGIEFHGTSSAHTLSGHFETVWSQSTNVPIPHKTATTKRLMYTTKSLMQHTEEHQIPIGTCVPYSIRFHNSCISCMRNMRHTNLIISLHSLIELAKERIDIISPNFADTRIFTLLVRAVRLRGIKVRVLTALQKHEGSYSLMGMTTNEEAFKQFKHMFEFRFSNRALCDVNGQNCRTCQTSQMQTSEYAADMYGVNHSKFMSIDDGKHVLIGSANLEPISLTYSIELNVELHPVVPDIQKKFQRVFDQFWSSSLPL